MQKNINLSEKRGLELFIEKKEQDGKQYCYHCFKSKKKFVETGIKVLPSGHALNKCGKCDNEW